jgi:hypothetical protein
MKNFTSADIIDLLKIIQAKNGKENAKHYLSGIIARRANEGKASPEATRKLNLLNTYEDSLPRSNSIYMSSDEMDTIAKNFSPAN